MSASAMTAFLMADDLFMLHEEALPELGVSEPVVIAIYLAAATAFGLMFFREIFGGRAALALLAAGLIGLSIFEDQTKIFWPIHDFLEDGAKLGGIYCWFLFIVLRSWDAARPGAPKP